MDHKEPDLTTMGGCMIAADLKIKDFDPDRQTVLLVGQTRVGKSTIFNNLSGITMKGQKTQFGDVELVNMYNKDNVVGGGYQSVTLLPNKELVDTKKSKYNLVDMAGFEDEDRSFVGVFMVSHMLGKVLIEAKKVKWMFVINQNSLLIPKIYDQLKPFQIFLSYFNIQHLLKYPNDLSQLVSSVSIVITRSQRQLTNYYNILNQMINFLKDQAKKGTITNERKVIFTLVTSIFQNKRIVIFKKAKERELMENARMLEQLEEPVKKWGTFHVAKETVGSVVILPFKSQFDALSEARPEDKKQYLQYTENLKNKLKMCMKLLKDFLQTVYEHWYQKSIDYSSNYMQLQSIINDNPYGSQTQMMQDIGIKIEESSKKCIRLKIMDNFIKINTIVDKLKNQIDGLKSEKSYLQISIIREIMTDLLLIFKDIVCTNEEESRDFMVFMCVFRRYLIQAENLNNIDENSCTDVPNIMADKFNTLLPNTINQLKAEFFSKFNPTPKQIRKIQKNSKIYDIQKSNGETVSEQQLLKMTEKKVSNSIAQAEHLKKSEDYENSLRKYIKAYRLLKECKTYYTEYPTEDQKEQYEFMLLNIFKKMGNLLSMMGSEILAIKIFEQFQMISLLMETFQKQMKKLKDKKIQLFQSSMQYIKTLKKLGKKEKMIQLYQTMIDQFIYYPNLRTKFQKVLATVLKNQNNVDDYINFLQNGSREWDHDIATIDPIIDQIVDRKLDGLQEDLEENQGLNEQGDQECGNDEDEDDHDDNEDEEENNGDGEEGDKDSNNLEEIEESQEILFQKRKQTMTEEMVDAID